MKKSGKNLQELILSLLSRSKAKKKSEIVRDIEKIIIEQQEERKVKPKYVINRALKNMVENDLIDQHDTEHSAFLSLTSSGRQKLRTIKLNSENHLVSTTWDGYWRIIIVDIPDARKKDQDAIRYLLKKAQFVQIKNSTWVSPLPMEHLMINMKKDLGLEEEILVIVSDTLDTSTEQLLAEKYSDAFKKED
tara:strand:+ start:1514 stop:2086 length:573 start_codon:yes stop_codon:yes gene_type:complete